MLRIKRILVPLDFSPCSDHAMDPALCLAGRDSVEAEVRRILTDNDGHPGHIFNLGHGVLPATDPDTLAMVVDLVHREGRAEDPPDRTEQR